MRKHKIILKGTIGMTTQELLDRKAELMAELETIESALNERKAAEDVEDEVALTINIFGHQCEYAQATKENGQLRWARTVKGEMIPLYWVTKELNYAFGERETAPVILNGVETELPLSLVGALFTIDNGIVLEIRNQPWRETFHPYAYGKNSHSVLVEDGGVFEEEYGTVPDEPLVVNTGVKKGI